MQKISEYVFSQVFYGQNTHKPSNKFVQKIKNADFYANFKKTLVYF